MAEVDGPLSSSSCEIRAAQVFVNVSCYVVVAVNAAKDRLFATLRGHV